MPKCNDCPTHKGVNFTQGDLFLCKKCKVKRFPTDSEQTTSEDPAILMVMIVDQLAEIKAKLACLPSVISSIEEIKATQTTMSTSLDFFNTLVEEMHRSITTLQEENKQLRHSNESLLHSIAEVERGLEEQNQYSRRENLEIQGIPETTEENTDDIIVAVLQRVADDITPEDIEVTHRIGRKDNRERNPRPRPIIVKFSSRRKRDKVYKQRKNIRNTTTDMIGYRSKNNIYINENLTPLKRNLLKEVNDKRKKSGYKFLWTHNGNIYVKKEQGTASVFIRNEDDLLKISN
ncbi:uncharacterized protein LOC144444419 [Glandiceps talaboti]